MDFHKFFFVRRLAVVIIAIIVAYALASVAVPALCHRFSNHLACICGGARR
jgi:hypothetical protein